MFGRPCDFLNERFGEPVVKSVIIGKPYYIIDNQQVPVDQVYEMEGKKTGAIPHRQVSFGRVDVEADKENMTRNLFRQETPDFEVGVEKNLNLESIRKE